MINALKLTTEDLMPVTAYQVSERGEHFLNMVPGHLRDEVHSVCYPKAASDMSAQTILESVWLCAVLMNPGWRHVLY